MHVIEIPPPEAKQEVVQPTYINGWTNLLSAASQIIPVMPTPGVEKARTVRSANASVTIIRSFDMPFSTPTESKPNNNNVIFTSKTSVRDCPEIIGMRGHMTAPPLCESNLIELQ